MNNIVPKSVQNIADKHARNNGYIRAQLSKRLKIAFSLRLYNQTSQFQRQLDYPLISL